MDSGLVWVVEMILDMEILSDYHHHHRPACSILIIYRTRFCEIENRGFHFVMIRSVKGSSANPRLVNAVYAIAVFP